MESFEYFGYGIAEKTKSECNASGLHEGYTSAGARLYRVPLFYKIKTTRCNYAGAGGILFNRK